MVSKNLKMCVKKIFKNSQRKKFKSLITQSSLTKNLNEENIIKLKDIHKGERCFIIGNGPSLNNCDLTKLKNEITFGFNAIYLNYENMKFHPTYYCLVDSLVAKDRADEIKKYKGPKIKFFKSTLAETLGDVKDSIWLKPDYSYYQNKLNNDPKTITPPEFSFDLTNDVKVSGTVTYFALQLAYYMGFSEIYMIGYDHYYKVPPKEEMINNHQIVSKTDDENHFHKDYFGKGKSWHDPMVFRMEEGYKKAKEVYEKDGREIYNATIGGHLEVFKRIKYDKINFSINTRN